MAKDICRAFTFINYHIPQKYDTLEEYSPEYSTTGFFDGLRTESLELDYSTKQFYSLWKYTLKRTAESTGQYSYQNIFGFGNNAWNPCADVEFWSDKTNRAFPLTFIVFLQLQSYNIKNGNSLEAQCSEFNNIIRNCLNDKCKVYSYATVDKNDFIVCIKSRNYENTVEAIKQLHQSKLNRVVYSYTIFAISNKLLTVFSKNEYKDLYEEKISSICLKGVTNSFDPEQLFSLDRKYSHYCRRLVNALYGQICEADDHRLYDILGEDDFRLIARDVSLGKLLEQLRPGGLLHHKEYPFYLFTANLILNTQTGESAPLQSSDIDIITRHMKENFQTPLCNSLQASIQYMKRAMADRQDVMIEKINTLCHAIWQLLQSLKALEKAPTKKYDFLTLYQPFEVFVRIMEEKFQQYFNENESAFAETDEIYEFIQKISMTIHGTLRTDIQFFQIRDFNVIINYAPAKLRAFYAFWTLRISYFYNMIAPTTNSYSFVLAPGMYKEVCVCELFMEANTDKRLMLIMTPERFLYSCAQFMLILSHEVSHFVGHSIRNRRERHYMWGHFCCRLFVLELYKYVYFYIIQHQLTNRGSNWSMEIDRFYISLAHELDSALEEAEKTTSENPDHLYHSVKSIPLIRSAFHLIDERYELLSIDECTKLTRHLTDISSRENDFAERATSYQKSCNIRREFTDLFNNLYQKFQGQFLRPALEIIKEITTEAYADLNAILTLCMTPKEYLLSFDQKNVGFRWFSEHPDLTGREAPMLVVRVGVVINTMSELVKKECSINNLLSASSAFSTSWNRLQLKKISAKLKNNPTGQSLATQTNSYLSGLLNHAEDIKEYRSIYNPEKKQFCNTEFDFFNDKYIFDMICDYLISCAQIYLNSIRNCQDSNATETKKILVNTFIQAKGKESALSFIQSLENFLQEDECQTANADLIH